MSHLQAPGLPAFRSPDHPITAIFAGTLFLPLCGYAKNGTKNAFGKILVAQGEI
ncbi:MAG TPA: hypothetical protein VKW06_19405 [Candidatus Angelobacter sp.]|nr:hypothetical protein [Candidatus Angelobacter sp.]